MKAIEIFNFWFCFCTRTVFLLLRLSSFFSFRSKCAICPNFTQLNSPVFIERLPEQHECIGCFHSPLVLYAFPIDYFSRINNSAKWVPPVEHRKIDRLCNFWSERDLRLSHLQNVASLLSRCRKSMNEREKKGRTEVLVCLAEYGVRKGWGLWFGEVWWG